MSAWQQMVFDGESGRVRSERAQGYEGKAWKGKKMRPLDGIRIIEMAGLAPSPYCGMILADFGAEVLIVDRLSNRVPERPNVMARNPFERGKRTVRVDLKTKDGVSILKKMIETSDVLIEPYRPGVMESLGLGPGESLKWNPRLIYARLTGWGQGGPYAGMAGHDIDYIALSGALSLFRREGEAPLPPCNILGDFAGGGLLCALGIVLALLERNNSGKGQVIDCAMLDGAAHLTTLFHGLLANKLMSLKIGTNMLDGGAPYYQVYETADGKYMAVGAIEAKFYEQLLKGLELDPSSLPQQNDKEKWPEMKLRFAEIFKTKTRDEWTAIFEGSDACVAPVLELNEVIDHPHNRERQVFAALDGFLQPQPAPRLSRTPGRAKGSGISSGLSTRKVLQGLGYTSAEIKAFFEKGIVE